MDGEQPLEELATVSGETISDGAASDDGSLTASEELSLGKFKTPQALLDAYNNLQAEFTKKCQRLAELEKDKIAAPSEQDLDANLQLFLEKHREATDFAGQLKEGVCRGKDNSLQAFDNVWAGIVLDQIKQSAANEKIMDKYVLSNESVKNCVIQSYLQQLKSNLPPLTISSDGQRVSGQCYDAPTSLGEAKALVEKMFD